MRMTEYTDRYQIFLTLGGGKNYEYMFFINRMVKLYNKRIHNQDEFTEFIKNHPDKKSVYLDVKKGATI